MTPAEFSAESLLRTYLHDRRLPLALHDAIVWAIAERLTGGKLPTLDATLRCDIDNQAARAPACMKAAHGVRAECATR